MRWNPDDWFGEKKEMTMGAEFELVIYDGEKDELLQNFNRAAPVFDRVPDNIWKDYYAYQAEIRTDPFDNPEDVIKQAIEFYKLADEEFQKENLYIIPVPWTGLPKEPVYCGTHVHVRYKNDEENKRFFEKAWGAYPFILAIADHTKNSEVGELNTSTRIKNSKHIRIPAWDRHTFNRGVGNARYADVTVNNLSSETDENPRNRLKKISTLETRMFDTPTLHSHLKFLIEAMFNVFSRIKDETPTSTNVQGMYDTVMFSRQLAIEQRYGYNKVLKDVNSHVCRDLAEMFGFNYPEITQYEFREQFSDYNMVDRKLAMRNFAWPNTQF